MHQHQQLPLMGVRNVNSLHCWILLLIMGFPTSNNGLSSPTLTGEINNKMLGKNQYLLLPHIPSSRDNNRIDSSNNITATSNETSSPSSSETIMDTATQSSSLNQNFLMEGEHQEQLENQIAIIDENDESYFQIFNQPLRFSTENNTEVIAQVGTTAHLPCMIHNIGEGVVSWIRRKGHHLLTVGLITYNSDDRFSAMHLKNSEDWTLQIKYVQKHDDGQYICQVTKHPPTSIFVYLNVVEARAEIVGPAVKYLTPGSTVKLICKVLQSTEATAYIFWYHDNRMINYDLDRGINVSSAADFHYSELTIQHATKNHSGNYSCVPSNSQPASVVVHIFKGDVAAMYHEHRSGSSSTFTHHEVLRSLLIVFSSLYLIRRATMDEARLNQRDFHVVELI